MKKIKRALISVSDKKNLRPLLKILKKNKVEIISSGGTHKEIKKLKFKCTEVSKYTGFPEILDGRVKTLHPKIYAGILNKRDNKSHYQDLIKNNFENIDLVIVNFYPFEETLKNSSNHSKIIENIDIGGPTIVRAAAKNYRDVTVITSSSQYNELIKEMVKFNGSTSKNFREKMSQVAFAETSYYDAIISNYFNKITKNYFPQKKIIYGNLIEKLRYGENPHQQSAIYSQNNFLKIKQLHGKQLSYNNYNDIFAALTISKSLPKNTGTVIVKHTNPCGVSILKDSVKCYKSALACDPLSAFGGVVACNYKISKKIASEINKKFLEVIFAKGFDKDSLEILKQKKNLRIIDISNFKLKNLTSTKSFDGSFMVQSKDSIIIDKKKLKCVTKLKPNKKELAEIQFAFNICKHVKSNAIVLCNNFSTIGIGAGQPSRLDSCKIAVQKAKQFQLSKIKNSIAASDAFFPFADGINTLIKAGVKTIIQPGGSIRDKEVINAANKAKVKMFFTGIRHFNH